MRPQSIWPDETRFIELSVRDADLASALRAEDYERYLGVSGDAKRIAAIQRDSPELAARLVASRRRKLALNNNAEVLALAGRATLHVWKYRRVRHAKWVAWRAGWNLWSLVALAGCFWHMITKRYSLPRLVSLSRPDGSQLRLFVSRVRRQKVCRSECLHFIPHYGGLAGTFLRFDQLRAQYVVLRWFESLPDLEPNADVDLLVADHSLQDVIAALESEPGILPCDLYSESGLARSTYRGTPYYPAAAARQLLERAVRHKDLCLVPNPADYFHSLAYHAVYHKGLRSNLSRGTTGLTDTPRSAHDFTIILGEMADRLGIDAEISLEGLHEYLQACGWGPGPEMLARLAASDPRNAWLQMLAERLPQHVHDQGLAVFVIRQRAVECGVEGQIIQLIVENGFEIVATKRLTPKEVEHAAARTRGGNWVSDGKVAVPAGDPAITVVAYDPAPLAPTRKQLRRFPERTNARIYAKEGIRQVINAQFPPDQSFNPIHSSDHAAEAWHLVEVLAPELLGQVRARVAEIHSTTTVAPLRAAA